ncbi:phage tail sheath family protein [Paenibacillus sp.]|uniref:phage tail sheath family protein n=1 Tax=Paenibacillus sp. TaxID=58172 RepID=UPI002810C8E7|nr:phage tail sheath family protein [Paenibacillus sp.]
MAGGTWSTQSKVRPGVYVNFDSAPAVLGTLGERGVASVALPLAWGEPQTILAIHAGEDVKERLGYDLSAPQLLLVREALKRSRTLLLYRLNVGTKATATHGALTATAKCGGHRGNDLAVAVRTNVDEETLFDVVTFVDDEAVDTQTVADLGELAGNAWIDFAGAGAPTPTAGVPLTGGADGNVSNADHTSYLAAIELQDFQTLALVSDDAALKATYASFARRLREDEGRKIQVVLANYPTADYEGVISVKNGVKLAGGTTIPARQATVWVAAATAAAGANESLTYRAYDGAVDVDERYPTSQIEAALLAGEFLFVPSNGRAVVEQDINSFTSFGPGKGKHFRKNRALRVLDGLANDWKRIFESYYIGKANNDADGRNLFRKECVKVVESYQGMNAVQNFDAQSDLSVLPGADSDAVVVEAYIQPVDSIEKVYMKVKVG